MPDLRFGESRATYEVVRCARKTLGVVVSPDGCVTVRAPFGAGNARIADFVDHLKPWIFKHLLRYQKDCPRRDFKSGEILPFLGERYRLKVTVNGVLEPEAALTGRRLEVKVGHHLSEEERRQAVKAALIGWYKGQAQEILPARVDALGDKVGHHPAKVKVKHQTRRWGSCTADRVIALNWQMVMAPPEVIDYVVVHELCHLKVHNHQREFWELVGRHEPEYKKLRKWLREKGRTLTFLSA